MEEMVESKSTPDDPVMQMATQSFIRKLEKLQENSVADNVKNTDAAGRSDGAMQLIRERMEEISVMIQKGDTEPSFQIGNSSFTIKEWEKFLERFDDAEDVIRELMRERIEKQTGEAAERKAASIEAAEESAERKAASKGEKESAEAMEGISALVSESTKCTYPSSVPEQEDIMYITWYTEEGIFCRKAGQSEGFEWSIHFEHNEDYIKVMDFLGRFGREDNLRFAAHENFWRDFLNDDIDIDDL